MKKINFKKFLLLFCILACVFGLTACTETISSDSAKESKKEQKLAAVSTELENWSVDMIKYFDVTSDDDVKANAENAISIDEINHDLYIVNPEGMNVATVEFCNSWVKSRSDLGRLKSIDSVELKISDETSTLGTVTVKKRETVHMKLYLMMITIFQVQPSIRYIQPVRRWKKQF